MARARHATFFGHRVIPALPQELPAAELPIQPSLRYHQQSPIASYLNWHHACYKVWQWHSTVPVLRCSRVTDASTPPPTEHCEWPTGPSPTSPASTCEPSRRPPASPVTTLGRERWSTLFPFSNSPEIRAEIATRSNEEQY